MADEYKSIYSGQEVDNAVATAQKALTTDNLAQTTGPSPNNVMSQAATTAAIQNIKAGTTVTVNNVAQTTWNADTKVDVFQGIDNTGKVMVVNSSGNLQAETIQSGGTTVTVNGQAQATWNADTKINIFQGTENAGKTFMVGQDGNAVLQTVDTSGGIIQLVGTEDTPINLFADTEIGQMYSVSGYIWETPNGNSNDKISIPTIFFRRISEQQGIVDNLKFNSNSRSGLVGGTFISFNTTSGAITNYAPFDRVSFNGGNMAGSSPPNIYAPTTAGTAGQVLQSTGGEPEWVDLNIEPTALDMTNSTISSIPESTVDYWQLKNSDSVIQIGVVNPTGESSFIILQDNLNSNNSQIQFGIGNFSTNNYANIDINTVGGSKTITLSVQNGTSKQILTMTPTQTTLGNETEAGDVLTTLTGIKKPSIEEASISVSSWTALSDSSPYTYQATITLSTVISSSSTVELINNQAVLFATYGFAIGSISGQNIAIYSIGQPSTSVTLTVGVTG